jgi:hypothetical protein
MFQANTERLLGYNLPRAISCISILHQNVGWLLCDPGCDPDIAYRTRKIAQVGEKGIGGEKWEEER